MRARKDPPLTGTELQKIAILSTAMQPEDYNQLLPNLHRGGRYPGRHHRGSGAADGYREPHGRHTPHRDDRGIRGAHRHGRDLLRRLLVLGLDQNGRESLAERGELLPEAARVPQDTPEVRGPPRVHRRDGQGLPEWTASSWSACSSAISGAGKLCPWKRGFKRWASPCWFSTGSTSPVRMRPAQDPVAGLHRDDQRSLTWRRRRRKSSRKPI